MWRKWKCSVLLRCSISGFYTHSRIIYNQNKIILFVFYVFVIFFFPHIYPLLKAKQASCSDHRTVLIMKDAPSWIMNLL